ncbi:hypothetical protein SAMN06296273_0341 [Nitrosomonas ureae]|uniref:Uncharacterized protein n=2 Tax=Nitrosomonas ureae TaxID=44577 RepID=A0A285BVF8_9PROT|nr:hypothetical protein SAMN06296273_0341 [Nitrosomonas ureae]
MLIKKLPGTIIRKLINNEEFSSFSQLRLISYKEIGSFHYESILVALERIQKRGKRVSIFTKDSKHFFLVRSPEGIRIVNAENEDDSRLIHDLAFLYPDKDIRLEALNYVIKQCWPSLPSRSYWLRILADRPLSETEFFQLISDISENPGRFKSTMKNSWHCGGEIDVATFFPSSFIYYEALIGSSSEGMSAEDWIDSILIPKLEQHIDLSLSDGLRCALALNIDLKLSPVKLVSDIPASELLVALSALVETHSPLILLGIIEIAIFHLDSDAKFLELASEALERLLGKKSEESGIIYAWIMMPSIVKTGLSRMSVDEKFWHYPPYWRGLAAFAHANILIETLEMDSKEAVDDFTGWLDNLITPKEVSATLLDMRKEPMWRFWDMTSLNLKDMIVGRLMLIKNWRVKSGLMFTNSHLVDSAIEDLDGEGSLLSIRRFSPLQDKRRIESMDSIEKIDSDLVTEFFSDIIDELGREPTGVVWKKLVVACRVQCFDSNLFDNLIKRVGNLTLEKKEKERFFNTLESAAEIAAVQRCKALADAVTHALVKAAGKFSTALDAKIGYYIILMSSGAIIDDSDWTEWIGKKMSEYAFSVPKGEACQQLLANLDDLSSLMKLKVRCLGRARKLAVSGIN